MYTDALQIYSGCEQEFHGQLFNQAVADEHKRKINQIEQAIDKILKVKAAGTIFTFPGAGAVP